MIQHELMNKSEEKKFLFLDIITNPKKTPNHMPESVTPVSYSSWCTKIYTNKGIGLPNAETQEVGMSERKKHWKHKYNRFVKLPYK